MPDFGLVLDRLVNAPLLAHPAKAEIVAAVVMRRAGLAVSLTIDAPATMAAPAPKAGPASEAVMRGRYAESGGRPYLFDAATGIATIEITGSLAHRQWHIGRSSGVTGYDGIGAQLDAALAAPDVRAIVLDLHTPGGEVAGAFQLADRIAAARARKPIVALVDEMAFSAGYLLAAACSEVFLAAPTASVGSIGVVVVHVSFEAALAAEGIKPTIIHAGARKADGNPYQDLPDEVRDRVQASVDEVYRLFVGRVATWRRLSPRAVQATEAGTFMGPEAVRLGLADGIAAPADIYAALAAEVAA